MFFHKRLSVCSAGFIYVCFVCLLLHAPRLVLVLNNEFVYGLSGVESYIVWGNNVRQWNWLKMPCRRLFVQSNTHR